MTPPRIAVDASEQGGWHLRPAAAVLTQLRATPEGLSAQEAARRLAADGANELVQGTRISPLQIFLRQFKSLIIWLLIGAGVISGALGENVLHCEKTLFFYIFRTISKSQIHSKQTSRST